MGSDFYNFQIFAGQEDPATLRQRLLAALGFRPERQVDINLTALRKPDDNDSQDIPIPAAVAIGPPGRWITLYDSWFGSDADRLALHLSYIAPLVVVSMEDSAALHLHQYRNGELMDQFANRSSVLRRWKSKDEKERYRGRPELWSDLLLPHAEASKLRIVWQEEGDADAILEETVSLFGWHPVLALSGYTIDHDGIPQYYRDYIDCLQKYVPDPEHQSEALPWTDASVDLTTFIEFEPDLTLVQSENLEPGCFDE